jgi:hypothetical protein
MKPFILILVTLCFSYIVDAQKNFNGEIIYKLHASGDNKPDAELKVLFGNNKLKLQFKEKEVYEDDALFVLLDSGAVFTVKPLSKTFKKKLLAVTAAAESPLQKTIMGFHTTSIKPENNGMGGLLGGLFGNSQSLFYVADSLTYFIPEKYRDNTEFVMIQKNKIVLGAEIRFTNRYTEGEEEDSTSKARSLITAEAISIKPMMVDDNEFIIPADFTSYKPVADTTMLAPADELALDTSVVAPKKPAVKKKAPVKKAPVKTTTKPKTAARKEP